MSLVHGLGAAVMEYVCQAVESLLPLLSEGVSESIQSLRSLVEEATTVSATFIRNFARSSRIPGNRRALASTNRGPQASHVLQVLPQIGYPRRLS